MKKIEKTPPSEFTRFVTVDAVGEDGTTLAVEADADERRTLADRLGLVGLDRLTADVALTPEEGGRLIRLSGTFTADVMQSCVVTLEPVESTVTGGLERLYDTEARDAEPRFGDFDVDGDEPPEPAPDGRIDVGAALAEQLALQIDPFPRKPGATFAGVSASPEGSPDDGSLGPFAALARFKPKRK